jgi:glycosyltransferase involved in cell wall biosynthesis
VDLVSWLIKSFGKPLILWLHGGDLPAFSSRHQYWTNRVLQRGDHIVSPTRYLVSNFRHLETISIIPNLIQIEDYLFKQRERLAPNVLWMRTFHDIYNPAMALDVLELLLPQHPGARLTMAGQDKGLLKFIQTDATRRGISDHLIFPGFLDTPAKQDQFANHDIFINTNHVDNMPVSVIEAAAFGLPIVATAVGGIPYLLEEGRTALLVNDGDASKMANAVDRLLQEPDLSATLSRNGRELALTCTWSQVKPKWEQVFSQVV